MNTVILTVSAVIATVLAALFAIPPLVDWNAFRGVFEVEASRLIGRDVRVRGDVRLSLLPIPYLQFEDVTVADAPGITGEPFLRASKFTMQLSAPPLLRGAIEASKIEIDGARFRLRLDANGQGNWQQLIADRNPYALAPTEVSLNEVNFADASLALERDGGELIGSLSGISGTLSAPQIEGPYRFVGSIADDGAGGGSEFRIGTGVWSPSGEAEVRVALKRKRDGREVIATGQLSAVGADPLAFVGRVEGDLVLFTGATATPAPDERADAKQTRDDARVQGLVRLDANALALDELQIALSGSATPQVLNGSARWQLAASEPLRIDLSSRLLEFERLGLSEIGDGGLALARFAARHVAGLNSTISTLDRPTELRLAVDRLTVGGEALSGIEAQVYASGNAAEVRRFKARVPGATTIVADGDLMLAEGGEAAFSGDINLAGGDLRGFSTWLSPKWGLDRRQAQRRFSLRGRLNTTATGWRLTQAQGRLGPTDLRGQAAFDDREGGDLRLDLTARNLDLDMLGDGALEPQTVRRFLLGAGASQAGSEASRLARAVRVRLDAATVRSGPTTLRDVTVDLARDTNGRTMISSLKFAAPDGVSVTAKGTLVPIGEGTPARIGGHLSGLATAGNQVRLGPIFQTLRHLTSQSSISTDAAGAIGELTVPAFRLAYRAEISDAASDEKPALALSLDGRLAAETVSVTLTSAGPVAELAAHPLRFSARASGPDARVSIGLLRQALFRGAASQSQSDTSETGVPTTLSIVGDGIARDGMVIHALMRSEGATSDYEGSLRVSDEAAVRLSGDVKIAAGNAAIVFRQWAALDLARRTDGWPLAVDLRFDRDAGTTRVDLSQFDLGQKSARGTLTISERRTAQAPDAAPVPSALNVSGRVETGPLQLLELADAILSPRVETSAPQSLSEPDERQSASIWPGRRFDLSLLEGVDADIATKTPLLEIADGAAVRDVGFRLVASQGRVALADISGTGPLQSKVRANLSVADVPGGYRLAGDVAAADLNLDRVANAASSLEVAGTGTVEVRFTGTGLSPQAAIALLRGEGRTQLQGVRLSGVAPGAIRAAADAFPADAKITTDALQAKLRETLSAQATDVGDGDLAITIRDGVLAFAPLEITTPAGRLRHTSTVDVAQLRAEGRWRLTPAASDDGTEPLPAIELIYTDRVSAIPTATPDVRIDALLRELVVRRLEGNVAELERLRRLDEERAREQERLRRERQRARELARQAAERARERELERERAARGVEDGAQGGSEVLPGLDSGAGPVIRQDLPPPTERGFGGQRGALEDPQGGPRNEPATTTLGRARPQRATPSPAASAPARAAVRRPPPRHEDPLSSWQRGVLLGNQ